MSLRRLLLGLALTALLAVYALSAAPGDRGIPEQRIHAEP